jgi:hypothetical protein
MTTIFDCIAYDYRKVTNESATILRISGTEERAMISEVLEGDAGRKVFGGPLISGPWCSTFKLGAVLVSHDNSAELSEERARTVSVADGDLVKVSEHVYTVRIVRGQWIELELQADGGAR